MRPGFGGQPDASAGSGQVRMPVGPTDTSGMTAATVKALLDGVSQGSLASAGDTYVQAGRALAQVAENLAEYAQRLFPGAWSGPAARQALAQFRQVHEQTVQQARLVYQAGPPLQWLGNEIIPWYQQNVPHASAYQKIASNPVVGVASGGASGLLAAHQQQKLNQAAQQHLAGLNERIMQANEQMPSSGTAVGGAYSPRQTTAAGPHPPGRTPRGSTTGGGADAPGGLAPGSGLAPAGGTSGGHGTVGANAWNSGQPSATASLAGYVPPPASGAPGGGAPGGGVPAGGVPAGGAPAGGGLGVPLIPGVPAGAGGAADGIGTDSLRGLPRGAGDPAEDPAAGEPGGGGAAGADSGAAGADGMAGADAAGGRGMAGTPMMGGAPGQQDSERQRHAWMAEDEDLWQAGGEHVVPAVIRG